MLVVGIAGGSGAGKTTVVNKITAQLPKDMVTLVPQDSYSWDSSHLPMEERKKINFDHPNAIEWELLIRHIKELKEGKSVENICAELEEVKYHIQTRLILPGTEIFYKNGRMGPVAAKFCKMFQLRPYIAMTPKKMRMFAVFTGSLEQVWHRAIRLHMLRKRKISTDIVYITHVGCSVKQQEWLKQEICKRVPFERVIMQKASFTNACNAGLEAISISYYSF